jgi:hypothetical protein
VGVGGDAGTHRGTQTTDASRRDDDGDSTGPSFPLGVYDSCAVETVAVVLPMVGAMGGAFGRDDATITLTQTGSVVTLTDKPAEPTSIFGLGFVLEFVASTNSSASLAPADQPFAQFSGVVSGCNVTAVNSGALTFDAKTLYFSIVGQVTDDAGTGCQITATFVCSKE